MQNLKLKQRNFYMKIVDKMSDSLNHRGPDDRGNWTDYNLGLSISHQRLSILDLTISGRQPMVSKNKRFVLAFNGEIYNYKELRSELRSLGYEFKSEGDTEVLLVGYQHFGKEILNKLNWTICFCYSGLQ